MPGASQWPAFTSTVFLVRRHSCDVVATHCGGDVTLTASNWPVWIPKLNYSLYSRCCPLLYPSPPTGSISSCLQLTLTEVTHLMDPRSGSLVTLGHAARNSNTCDVILNGISGSRTHLTTTMYFSVTFSVVMWTVTLVTNFWRHK